MRYNKFYTIYTIDDNNESESKKLIIIYYFILEFLFLFIFFLTFRVEQEIKNHINFLTGIIVIQYRSFFFQNHLVF